MNLPTHYNKTVLASKNRINNTEKKIDEKNSITAIFSSSETIYYAISGEVKNFHNNGIQQIFFKEKGLRILQITEASEKIYVLTSKGEFELVTGKKISMHSRQPV